MTLANSLPSTSARAIRPGRRLQGVLQRRPRPYHPEQSPVRLYLGGVRISTQGAWAGARWLDANRLLTTGAVVQFLPVSASNKGQYHVNRGTDACGCSTHSRRNPGMWKRPSHRNRKTCPGYVPEMPFAFFWMCMATLVPGVRSVVLGVVRPWQGCVGFVLSVCLCCVCVGRILISMRANDSCAIYVGQSQTRANQRPGEPMRAGGSVSRETRSVTESN